MEKQTIEKKSDGDIDPRDVEIVAEFVQLVGARSSRDAEDAIVRDAEEKLKRLGVDVKFAGPINAGGNHAA